MKTAAAAEIKPFDQAVSRRIVRHHHFKRVPLQHGSGSATLRDIGWCQWCWMHRMWPDGVVVVVWCMKVAVKWRRGASRWCGSRTETTVINVSRF